MSEHIPAESHPCAGAAPHRWRKKPVVIEAVQILEDAAVSLFELIDGNPDVDVVRGGVLSDIDGKVICVHVRTLEGRMTGNLGDWLIRGVKGEFYPCKPDIFAQTYEPAGAAVTQEAAPLHASAPAGYKCSDCRIDGEACPTCYTVWWKRRHPNVQQIGAQEAAPPPPWPELTRADVESLWFSTRDKDDWAHIVSFANAVIGLRRVQVACETRAASPTPWQPIETAPKDRHILAVVNGTVRVVRWGKTSHLSWTGFCLADQGVENFDICDPTCWSEIPVPPPAPEPEEPRNG